MSARVGRAVRCARNRRRPSRPAVAENAVACDIASADLPITKIFGLPHAAFVTRKLANPNESACEMSAWADGAPAEQPLPKPVTATGILPNWMRYSVPAGRAYAGFWTGTGLPWSPRAAGNGPLVTADMLYAAASGSLTSLVPSGAVVVNVGGYGATHHVAVSSPNGDAAVGVWQYGGAGGLIIWIGAPGGAAAAKLDAVGKSAVPAFLGTMHPSSTNART